MPLDSAAEPAASPRPVIYVALLCNATIALAKFTAAALSGSAAMAAEGVHSTVDIGPAALWPETGAPPTRPSFPLWL